MAAKHPLSGECSVAIHHVASYELHISNACLSMACYCTEGPEEPCFATFFENQAKVKREYEKQFLRSLRECE